MALGDVISAWLLLRQGEVAVKALEQGRDDVDDEMFYRGKVAAAKFFAKHLLPRLAAERAIAEAVDNEIMDLPEEAF
jgi:hypothetical protein